MLNKTWCFGLKRQLGCCVYLIRFRLDQISFGFSFPFKEYVWLVSYIVNQRFSVLRFPFVIDYDSFITNLAEMVVFMAETGSL